MYNQLLEKADTKTQTQSVENIFTSYQNQFGQTTKTRIKFRWCGSMWSNFGRREFR